MPPFSEKQLKSGKSLLKSLDLQLSGSQINLNNRPLVKRTTYRSGKPFGIRRPMSATPGLGYQDRIKTKTPSWTRPQSADNCSNSSRRNKLAARFSSLEGEDDQGFFSNLGTTYTVSSSNLLHSLMESSSLDVVPLDSDLSITPSPRPVAGDTLKVAPQPCTSKNNQQNPRENKPVQRNIANLEPGLASKPPLPPTPDLKTPKNLVWSNNMPDKNLPGRSSEIDDDEIINLKFQRWFPDSILNSGNYSIDNEKINKILELKDPPFQMGSEKNINTETTDSDSLGGSRNSLTEGELSEDYWPQHKSKIKPDSKVSETSRFKDRKTTKLYTGKEKMKITGKSLENLKTPKKSKKNKIDKPILKKSSSLEKQNDVSRSEKRRTSLDVSFDSKENLSNQIKENDDFLEKFNKFQYKFDEYDSEKNRPSTSSSVYTSNMESYLLTSSTPISESKVELKSVPDPSSTSKQTNNILEENNKETSSIPKINVTDFTAQDTGTIIQNSQNDKYLTVKTDSISESTQDSYNEYYNEMLSKQLYLSDVEKSWENNGSTQNVLVSTSEHSPVFTNFPQDNSVHKFTKSSVEFTEKKSTNIENKSKDNGFTHSVINTDDKKSTQTPQTNENNKRSTTSLKSKNSENAKQETKDVSDRSTVKNDMAKSSSYYLNDKHEEEIWKQKYLHSSLNNSTEIPERDNAMTSTYDDIVSILKVLESEEANSIIKLGSTSASLDDLRIESAMKNTADTRQAIMSYLDEADRRCDNALNTTNKQPTDQLRVNQGTSNRDTKEYKQTSGRMGELLSTPSPELAQQVMTLTLELDEKRSTLQNTEIRLKELEETFEKHKQEAHTALERHQSFIDKLLKEKKKMNEDCSKAVKEMESKHMTTVKVLEEKHKVELKRACDKTAAAEKIKRDRWVDMKTKKIKELTVKGLEPELNRMAAVHQQELAELRRGHQRQLEEAEAACARRLAAARLQADSEKEAAVIQEREAARSRLEQEMVELEKSYQDQRKRLLAEIRTEREQIQKENAVCIAEKESELQKKFEKYSQDTQEKLSHQEKKYQDELEKMKGLLEAEKESWISRQKVLHGEKERAMREECKRERDRHIELAIRKLESEAAGREQAAENKLRREKERYESEIKEMENVVKELRQKLKDSRAEINIVEEKNLQTSSQLSQVVAECNTYKQIIERLTKEKGELQTNIEEESKRQLQTLKSELMQARMNLREQMNIMQTDKERELQQVYSRVREAITKKDETISLMEKQRDAALEQCSQLEKMLQQQRKELHNRK